MEEEQEKEEEEEEEEVSVISHGLKPAVPQTLRRMAGSLVPSSTATIMEVQLYVGKIRNLPIDQVFRRRIGFALTTVFSAIDRKLKRRALVALTNAVAAHNAAAEAQSGAGTCIHTLPQGVAAMAAFGGGYRATVVASAQDLARINVRQPFKLNNVALKCIRDRNENPPGHPITNGVDLTRSDPYQIGILEKRMIGSKTARDGFDYRFKDGRTQPWSWRQMLAAMNVQDKELVLGSNPTLGVVRIR